MSKIGIFYGSSTGNTEAVAKVIAEKLGAESFDVAKSPTKELNACNKIILGTSTLGYGELQDDWDNFISQLEKADLTGKTVAIFGFGDADGYPDTFVDGIGILYEAIAQKGCVIVGEVSTDGYEYDESKAVINGKFVGLPLDDDNQGNKTKTRVESWLEAIAPHFN